RVRGGASRRSARVRRGRGAGACGSRLVALDAARRGPRRAARVDRRERRRRGGDPESRLRLGFDATSLTPEGKGLARFQREFLATAAELGEPEELVVFAPEEPEEGALPAVAGWRYVHVETRPMLRWEQLGLPRAAKALRLDVVLTLSERAALWGPRRVVYVFEHPRLRARRNRQVGVGARQRLVDGVTLGLFFLAQRRAAAVLAASESTRRDL